MPGRGWIMAAVVALGLAASAGAGRAAGEVTVEGNRFLRDGAPWVAEGVTLVGLVSPEAVGEEADLRRGAGGVRPRHARRGRAVRRRPRALPGQPGRARPEVEAIYDPAYRDEVLAAIAADPGGRLQRHRLDAVAGARRAPATRPACRRRRPGAPGARSPPRSPRTAACCSRSSTSREGNPRSPSGMGDLAEAMQGLIDALRAAGSRERAAGRRGAVLAHPRRARRRSTTRSGSSAMPCIRSSASTTRPGRIGSGSSAPSPRPIR